ncbi:ABC transporter permease [Anaerotruncus colihominis]|mgnify:CR=1 FL=1|uniref:ABC transporter permease n=1 Tax=Anaerotruncus colihominis TaxID=169435 RepID=A0A3E3IE02_9FIRM|nr:ABC transporter permease [Anaerotruncus colihominis]RGE65298.1 ABC transporter permease [Anaerotruncus colihominis]
MTWPFENDTSAVIKKYAKKSIKANRRTTLSIMTAILIASTFLCTLCTFVQSYWNQGVQQEIASSGDWDAQLLEVQAGQIDLIRSNNAVQMVMVKGNNQTAKLSESTELPYLLIQNCDAAYWNTMHEKNLILQGRVPQAPGEIVVGKNFFEQNPSFEIGDTLEVNIGERKIGNKTVDFLSPIQTGETFVKTSAAQYTIVGEIDMTISSAYNGYPAYGWLEPENLPESTDVVVYLQAKKPSQIFDLVPQIAENIGLQSDEYGDYPYRYHTALLGMYGIYEAGHFWNSDLPKLFAALILVVAASIAVFAYIIRGAFSISAKRKIKELGILKSIGMTPKQIRLLIIYEARWLSILPICISAILGYIFSYGVLAAYSSLTSEVTGSRITPSFSPWAILIAMLLSFLTVLLAASGPAKQMGKLRPIEAVKESWKTPALDKSKKHTILRTCFGFLGKVSANSISANKKLFRTCTGTLCLCMILMFSFLAVFSVSDVNNTKAEQDSYFNVNITIESGEQVDDILIQKLKEIPHVKELATYTMANCAIWVSDSDLSEDFVAAGGFNTKAAGEYVVKRDGQYRIPCVLIGLEQDAYQHYLSESGINSSNTTSAIVVNSVVKNPDSRGYEAKKEQVSYLNIDSGQHLEVTEKFLDSIPGNYSFDLEVLHTLPQMPNIGRNIAFYTLPIIVPMEEYYTIIQNFAEDRAVYNYRTYMNLLAENGLDIKVQQEADQICSAYLSNSDFYTSSKTERAIDRDKLTNGTMVIVYSMTLLFGIVGISSATSAIMNSLYQRRKEFAMLRSVGLDKKSLLKLLYTEAFLLASKPILIGLPILFGICAVLLWLQDVTVAEFITVFPLWGVLAYIILIIVIITAIYMAVSKKIRKDNIVEVLKNDVV